MTARQEREFKVSESSVEPVLDCRYVSWGFLLGTDIHRGCLKVRRSCIVCTSHLMLAVFME